MTSVAKAMEEEVGAASDKRPQVQALLTDIFALMSLPVRLDFTDLPDGSLGVALHVDGEHPDLAPSKRNNVVDSIQFLVNKVVNRPNAPRRWVNLGLNDFPQPRKAPRPLAVPGIPGVPAVAPVAAISAPHAVAGRSSEAQQAPRGKAPAQPTPVPRASPAPANQLQPPTPVSIDPVWAALGKALAQKSVALGRSYGVMRLSAEARASMVQACAGLPGLAVKSEGEGPWRRVAFRPEKLTPLPKKNVMPDYGDGEEE